MSPNSFSEQFSTQLLRPGLSIEPILVLLWSLHSGRVLNAELYFKTRITRFSYLKRIQINLRFAHDIFEYCSSFLVFFQRIRLKNNQAIEIFKLNFTYEFVICIKRICNLWHTWHNQIISGNGDFWLGYFISKSILSLLI